MEIQSFTFNPFAENTYILYDETLECVIVDPGCYTPEEQQAMVNFIAAKNLKPVQLLNTHCHLDHIFGNRFIADTFKLKLYCHPNEVEWLEQVPLYSRAMYGVSVEPSPEPAGFLNEGDTVTFGNTALKVLLAPGHSPGSIVFYNEKGRTAIVGDVIFYRSIGRSDLPGGDYQQLETSIRTKIYTLPGETRLYSGHGEPTTVDEEMRFSPFVRA
ncbi:MAG TPA: MBL fold metallo-hydrolase [Bacteroidia bacterium]|nr:MBL fold metallo-hydrolase [Bacteroidia bacterium]